MLDGRGEISIDEDSSAEEVMEKIFRFSTDSLRKTEAIADSEQIEQAALAISGCRRVLFIGAGTSGISARYAFSRFFRLGIPCSAEVDPVLYYMQSSILGPEDILFSISSSGRTSVVVEAARAARQSGATVVSLSDFAISPLSQIANIKLYTTPRNVNFYMVLEMPLLIGQITLIDVLFSIVSLMTSGETKARYAITKQTADRMKNR
ncbi:MAG: MurR/RpiR family transcriptional regulator [Spirochaetaceae bacterium]|nr:MurR/RpiR family transcriptional regulator [Spirochaetaceae bacterium]MDT8297914.1 MurR/RpiR family transcriptional regulator [Spirochaetaceae bacterium]